MSTRWFARARAFVTLAALAATALVTEAAKRWL
jgi:hypothetical protein